MSKNFTLVEVLIALAILSLGILAATNLLSLSRERSRIADIQWQEQHKITQAAEYFLLAGTAESIPERFFPYSDYSITNYYTSPVDLPTGVPEDKGGWQLRTLHLQLRDSYGEIVRELAIDRIIRVGKE